MLKYLFVMNSNDGTLRKHLFNTEGLARGEDRGRHALRLPGGPALHLPSATLAVPQQYLSLCAELNIKTRVWDINLLIEKKKKERKPVIYVDLVGVQCCPAVTVEPVTEIIQHCSFTPVKGINTPLALQIKKPGCASLFYFLRTS